MAELDAKQSSFFSRLLRPKKSRSKLSKAARAPSPAPPLPTSPRKSIGSRSNGTGERRLHYGAIYRPENDNLDEQTGERRDDTDLLHGLAHHASNDSLDEIANLRIADVHRPPGEPEIKMLPSPLWEHITTYLSPADAASLAFSTKTLAQKLGPSPWLSLEQEQNRKDKIKFLLYMDESLPGHLLCFNCVRYHKRTSIGDERLKATLVWNPLYHCPLVGEPGIFQPRARIVPSYTLPFTFVQLVVRHHHFSPNHGIPLDVLSRRWKDKNSQWVHQMRYYIHKGHLLVRVISRSFAAPNLPISGQRNLLYSREDYTPYFSCCAHWRDGELMDICKCALGHIPPDRTPIRDQLKTGPQISMALHSPNPIVSLCGKCRPMRRCPECPTEYLVELKLSEDKEDPLVKFKQSIVVTRWSDLGDGSSPHSEEWAAVTGTQEEGVAYDSFQMLGKRALSGIFEAQSGVMMPGQRLISLNPRNEKLGEEGHKWY